MNLRRAPICYTRESYVGGGRRQGATELSPWTHSWNRTMGVIKVQGKPEARNPHE
jgi:hypothetical protein